MQIVPQYPNFNIQQVYRHILDEPSEKNYLVLMNKGTQLIIWLIRFCLTQNDLSTSH